MVSWGSSGLRNSQRYSSTVADLSEADLKALITVLATNPPPEDSFSHFPIGTSGHIEKTIRKLSSEFFHRSSSLFSFSSYVKPSATLCGTHKALNQHIISHILRLIKREVEGHLELIIQWHSPRSLDPALVEVIRSLRSLRGLWWEHDANFDASDDAVMAQKNKCEACMISRIIASSEYLQYLRAALCSRTRKRSTDRPPPKLLRVVEEALRFHHRDTLQPLNEISYQLSSGLKEARKYAASRKRWHSRRPNREKCVPRNLTDHETTSSNEAVVESGRRPSSQTVMFCLLSDLHPPYQLSVDPPKEREDEGQQEIQEQIILDIINAYGPWTPSLTRTSRASNLDAQQFLPPPLSNASDSGNGDEHLTPGESDWEDDWDESSINIASGNPDLDQLIDQIGDLIVENEGLAESEPGTSTSRRKITIVSPTRSYETASKNCSQTKRKPARVESHTNNESRVKTTGRNVPGATTWGTCLPDNNQDRSGWI